MGLRNWIRTAVIAVGLACALNAHAELAASEDSASEDLSTPESPRSLDLPSPTATCERTVNSETCSDFRRRRPDLKDQFLRCEAATKSNIVGCGKGLWSAAKEYAAIFEAPELSPLGKSFLDFQTTCFKDKTCREDAYKQGVSPRVPTADELDRLAKVPAERRLQVQPFYYGQLEQLKAMKAKELRLMTQGIDLHSRAATEAMRESFPLWKPEYRAIYTSETWTESAQKAVTAIKARLKELGVELQCLDDATVSEMLCFGAGMLVDPLIVLKGVTMLPRATKVMSKLVRGSQGLKSAAVLRLEAKWGRALTADELEVVDRAHKIGALEKGKDGTDAGVGNYTQGQLRRKYRELEDTFNREQIRDLMELEVVGLTPREQALLRAEQMRKAERRQENAESKPSRKLGEQPIAVKVTEEMAEATLDQLSEVEKATNAVKAQSELAAQKFAKNTEFQLHQRHIAALEKKQDEILSGWQMDSVESTKAANKQIADLNYKIAKAKEDADLWKLRATNDDWNVIRENPKALAPNKVYTVQTDRGEKVKVFFDEKVTSEMAWSGANETRELAMKNAAEGIGRGYNGSGGSGIDVMFLDGQRIHKVQVTGRAIGAYRVYGIEKNGVIYFVHWEQESLHDAKYLQRVIRSTENAFNQLNIP